MPNTIQKNRLAAFNKQEGLCYYCNVLMWLKEPSEFARKHHISLNQTAFLQCTAEHLIAREDGGNNKQDNIVAACKFCNSKRHQRKTPSDPSSYQKLVQKRLKQLKWHPQQLHHLISTRNEAVF